MFKQHILQHGLKINTLILIADRLFGDTGDIVLSHHRYTSEIDHWLQLLRSQFYGMDVSVVDVCMCSGAVVLIHWWLIYSGYHILSEHKLLSFLRPTESCLQDSLYPQPYTELRLTCLLIFLPHLFSLSIDVSFCFIFSFLHLFDPFRLFALHLLMSRSLILKKPFHTWLTNQKNFMPSNNCLNHNSYTFTLESQTVSVS